MTSFFSEKLQQLAQIGQRRAFPQIEHQSKWIQQRGQNLLNLSSNDYLGIAAEPQFLSQFLAEMSQQPLPLTSSSSRLLTEISRFMKHWNNVLHRIINAKPAYYLIAVITPISVFCRR